LQVLFFVFAKFLEWRKERCRFASSPGARSSRQRDECKKREVVSGARASLIDSQKIHKFVDIGESGEGSIVYLTKKELPGPELGARVLFVYWKATKVLLNRDDRGAAPTRELIATLWSLIDEETERWTAEDIANEYIVFVNLTSATCGVGEEW
jgi:hypothetical protein